VGHRTGYRRIPWTGKILALPIDEITPETAEEHAVHTSFGIRLLMASNKTRHIEFTDSSEKTLKFGRNSELDRTCGRA